MEFEANRLLTYTNWPQNASVNFIELAKHGFYATGEFQEAQCHWCKCKISDWNIGDTVEERHRKIAPTCNFLTTENCGNVPIPKPDMFNEDERLATFTNWPNSNIEPEALAKAGFFYLKRADEVKCAWCDVVIAKWEVGDDAFQEHQRFFPDCPRVKLDRLITTVSDDLDKLCIETTVQNSELASTSNSSLIENYQKIAEELHHLQQARVCKICLDEEVGVVFLPCGHLVTCLQCAPTMTHCPICRSAIKGLIRASLS